MKRLYIIVEGQSEQEFVNTMVAPYMIKFGITAVVPILIRTSKSGRGGFVNYEHLKNDVKKLLSSPKTDFIVTMFVDFFRCPELPNKEKYEAIENHEQKVVQMECQIAEDINDSRFVPYIQLHEFESLLYASNKGFEYYFDEKQSAMTKQIIDSFDNPEMINSSPTNAPSKRLLRIKNDYDKVIEGNLIALEVGLDEILERCPRFNKWIEMLKERCE